MLICKECVAESKLSDLGKTVWDLSRSVGPCESCEKVCDCGEVSCQIDAYWDDNISEMLDSLLDY